MRAPKGSGSLYQRASDGLWMASVAIRSEDGRRRRRVFSSRSRVVVEARLAAWLFENPLPERAPSLPRGSNLRAARSIATHTAAEWSAYARSVAYACHYCSVALPRQLVEKDHKQPVARGGSDGIDNLAVACRACNREKGTLTEAEYVAYLIALERHLIPRELNLPTDLRPCLGCEGTTLYHHNFMRASTPMHAFRPAP